ncbi:murein biosynthesis integral membrane protein MurJ [Pedobacter jejuensis]|uniref:Murein biosynthesis integral membrane protein MurJ n=1 Tax=Pedobacter jejuensis TaxID=1268550 RepID=A0A3N0BW74_9SPHI|nr:murein biosynthesis integral membrane protein MurJ [Pedobacter jejuensis]RNL53956.1 murein biosynthesis integral membrane protein MurJ [Pedobacter jejuensis]
MLTQYLKQSWSNPVIRSSFAVFAISMAIKLFGYLEKILVAYYWGTSGMTDIYNVVVGILLSIFVLVREIIEPGFLSGFLSAMHLKDSKGAWNLFNLFARLIFFVMLLLVALIYIKPGLLADLFAPGFSTYKKMLSTQLLRFTFPAIIFLALSALTGIALNGMKKFAVSTVGELFYKVSIMLSIVFFFSSLGIYAIAAGIILGSFLKLLSHGIILIRHVSFGKVTLRSPYTSQIWKLTWPLMIGMLFSQLSSLIDNALASYLPDGSLSALGYAKKLIEFPIAICPYIISVILFPYFTEFSIAKKTEELKSLLFNSLSWIFLLFLPLALFYYMCSFDIVALVFQRGAFDHNSTMLTSAPLKLYGFGMVFFAIETILVIFYFADSDTKTPIFIGIICAVENIFLTFMLIKVMGYTGIALALSISKATKTIILLLLLKRKFTFPYKPILSFISKVSLACVLTAAVIFLSRSAFNNICDPTFFQRITFIAVTFLTGAITYILILRLLGIRKNNLLIL